MHFSRWQTIGILGVAALVCLAALPNVLPASTLERFPAWAHRKIKPGYDLTGGGHYQLAVDANYVQGQLLEELRDEVGLLMRGRRVGYDALKIRNGGVELWVRDADAMPRALAALDLFTTPPRSMPPRAAWVVFDGRPSLTATRNPQPPEQHVTVDVADRLVRLEPTQVSIHRRIARARQASIGLVERRVSEVGAPYKIREVGEDRIALDIPFPIEHIPQP